MNEFLILLEVVDRVGWVCLVVLFSVAMGMLIFDRPPKKQARVEVTSPSQGRKAA